MTPKLTSLNGTPMSRFTFGTMQFGGRANARDSRAMFESCRTQGITHFDTAYVYTDGASETLLGEFAKTDREALLIATKTAYKGGAGSANICAQFDQSRQRLAMDMVDILYLHRFDAHTPLQETFETLATLKSDGKIRYIGVSNYAAWQIMKAKQVAEQFDLRIDLIQPMYSLVKRQAEVEIFPMAMDQGIAIAPYSPLGGGLLSGKYAAGGNGRLTEDSRYRARYGQDWMWQTAKALAETAKKLGTEAATLAVAWAAAHPAAPHPILSARTPSQLGPSLAATQFEMSDALYAEISALSQPPAPATDRLEEA